MSSLRNDIATLPIALTVLTAAVGVALFSNFDPADLTTATIALVATVVLFSFVSIWIARRLTHPLEALRPIVDEAGLLQLTSETPRDIPVEFQQLSLAIRQIAEKQHQDIEAMRRLERVRSEFLGNVSHELRTPIFAVQGFIETLLDGAIDDKKVNRDFLERARVQAERLNSLLNDLIDISRIESGEMRMSFRTFDIQPFLRDFAAEMQPQAKAKNMELYFTGNVLLHHDISVYADKDRIKQVLINLVDNAIKYSEAGTSIKMELQNSEPTEKQITIRIADTGIGIGSEHLPRLFERFYRVDKGRARSQPGGTGLGLAICKHIVEAHRSRISVTSEPGKGSVFSFTLPKEPF